MTINNAMTVIKHHTVGLLTDGTATGSFLPTLCGIFGAESLRTLDRHDLHKPRVLAACDIIVLPGVSSEKSHYPEIMDKEAQKNIIDHVQNGMNLWMSCAAFFFGCESYSYTFSDDTTAEREGMGIFKGHAFGPIGGQVPVAPEKSRFSDTRLVTVDFNDEAGRAHSAGICYSNGAGYIPAPDANVSVIGRYSNAPGKPVAVVTKEIGRGTVIGSGVLPEMDPAEMHMPARLAHRFPHLAKLHREVLQHEYGRKALLGTIVHNLAPVRRESLSA